jgi:hypothetical protein
MLRMPIVSDESNTVIGGPFLPLPVFYMEDYTVLGFRVLDLEASLRLLENAGIGIHQRQGCSELLIEHRGQIPNIIQMLNENGMFCVIADVVGQVYQG